MSERILFVDDEEHILQSIKRQLRKRFKVDTALGGEQALKEMQDKGPYSVIVSDMRMPGMDGIQLLTKVRDLYPDTVRMMLTGNADQETAIEAVNKGQIFRFLNKPCPTAVLVPSIALAQRQYRLLVAEKDLLDKTLKGAVKVLAELLSLANPVAFSAGSRIKNLVVELGKKVEAGKTWQLEIAALMSQIGCITIPSEIINKLYANRELEPEEQEMYFNHPKAGASLIENIPRLEIVAGIIENQLKDHQEVENIEDLPFEASIGAQIIRLAIDHDRLMFHGNSHSQALNELKKKKDKYHPKILSALESIKIVEDQERVVSLKVKDLAIGMITEESIVAKNGVMLAPKGQKITWPVLQGIKNFSNQVGVKEPILVKMDHSGQSV